MLCSCGVSGCVVMGGTAVAFNSSAWYWNRGLQKEGLLCSCCDGRCVVVGEASVCLTTRLGVGRVDFGGKPCCIAGWLTCCLPYWFSWWLAGRVGWLVDWLVVCLPSLLSECMVGLAKQASKRASELSRRVVWLVRWLGWLVACLPSLISDRVVGLVVWSVG